MYDLRTGAEFRMARLRANLPQTEVAKALGLTQATIHRIESQSFVGVKYQMAFKYYLALLHGWSLREAIGNIITEHD